MRSRTHLHWNLGCFAAAVASCLHPQVELSNIWDSLIKTFSFKASMHILNPSIFVFFNKQNFRGLWEIVCGFNATSVFWETFTQQCGDRESRFSGRRSRQVAPQEKLQVVNAARASGGSPRSTCARGTKKLFFFCSLNGEN